MIILKNKLTPMLVNGILNSVKLNINESNLIKRIMEDYKAFFANKKYRYFDKYMNNVYEKKDETYHSASLLLIMSFGLGNELFAEPYIASFNDIQALLSYDSAPSSGVTSKLHLTLFKCSETISNIEELNDFVQLCANFELPSLPESMKKFCSFCFIKTSDQPATINKEEYLITFMKKPTFNKLDCYIEDKHNKVIILSKMIKAYNISFEGKCYFIDKNNKKIDRSLGKVSFTFSFNNG